jgi:hypothetical protein
MRNIDAQPTDFLAACQAVPQRNIALEEIQEKGADVVLSFFRLAKNSLVHKMDNTAMLKTVSQTRKIAVDFAATVGGEVAISFADQTIFVCGQLLRASRSIYESAMEMGTLLERCQVSEISFSADLTEQDLLVFAEAFSISSRDPERRDTLLKAKLPNINVRKVDPSGNRPMDERNASELEKMLRIYASALLVMRRFFNRTSEGKPVVPNHVKRIAQRLVSLGLRDNTALLTMTTLANAHRDDAGRAIQTAILAVVIARRVTNDRQVLAQLAMAALVADVGRIRTLGQREPGMRHKPSDEAEKNIPTLTSALCIAASGVNTLSALRAVIAYETTFIERERLLGPLYDRTMSPLVQSKILHVARALIDQIAPSGSSKPLSPLDALAAVAQQPTIDTMIYKLLVSAVGLVPTGTVVEFETGEWAVVLGPSANPNACDKQRVRLVTDKSGQPLSAIKEIDLGDPSKGQRYPRITGALPPDRARFNIAGVLLSE